MELYTEDELEYYMQEAYAMGQDDLMEYIDESSDDEDKRIARYLEYKERAKKLNDENFRAQQYKNIENSNRARARKRQEDHSGTGLHARVVKDFKQRRENRLLRKANNSVNMSSTSRMNEGYYDDGYDSAFDQVMWEARK